MTAPSAAASSVTSESVLHRGRLAVPASTPVGLGAAVGLAVGAVTVNVWLAKSSSPARPSPGTESTSGWSTAVISLVTCAVQVLGWLLAGAGVPALGVGLALAAAPGGAVAGGLPGMTLRLSVAAAPGASPPTVQIPVVASYEPCAVSAVTSVSPIGMPVV